MRGVGAHERNQMTAYLQVLIGLIVVLLLGYGVRPLMDLAKKEVPLTAPDGVPEGKWSDLTAGNEAGRIIGTLERFFFFGAFWVDAPSAIGVWLALKVASKWNVWRNVVALPDKLDDVKPLDYAIARRRWSSHLLITFFVGTLANLLIGFLGVVVGRHGIETVRAFCS